MGSIVRNPYTLVNLDSCRHIDQRSTQFRPKTITRKQKTAMQNNAVENRSSRRKSFKAPVTLDSLTRWPNHVLRILQMHPVQITRERTKHQSWQRTQTRHEASEGCDTFATDYPHSGATPDCKPITPTEERGRGRSGGGGTQQCARPTNRARQRSEAGFRNAHKKARLRALLHEREAGSKPALLCKYWIYLL